MMILYCIKANKCSSNLLNLQLGTVAQVEEKERTFQKAALTMISDQIGV